MPQRLGETHTYEPGDDEFYSVEETGGIGATLKGALGRGSDDGRKPVNLQVQTGKLSRNYVPFSSQPVFYPGEGAAIKRAESYEAQFRTGEHEYSLDEFLDTYDLHGEITLQGRYDDDLTLIDTDDESFNGNFRSMWEEAGDALDDGRVDGSDEDREYLTGENVDWLAPLITAAGPERFEDYDDLVNRVTVTVPEIFIGDNGEYRNDITDQTYEEAVNDQDE